jgi:hypothetical protein
MLPRPPWLVYDTSDAQSSAQLGLCFKPWSALYLAVSRSEDALTGVITGPMDDLIVNHLRVRIQDIFPADRRFRHGCGM